MAAERQSLSWNEPSRRRMPRYVVQAPLDVIVLRSGIPDKVPGRSVNLSECGIAVVVAAELVPGEAVGVELHVPQRAQPLRSRALVRYQDELRCGMEFSGLSVEQQAAIRAWTEELRAEPVCQPAPATAAIPAEPAIETQPNGEQAGNLKWKKHEDSTLIVPPPPANPSPATRSRQGVVWKILLSICAILLAVFWWRWNRGWEELESGLSSRRDTPEKAQMHVAAEEMQKLVIHRVDPDYPVEARRANLQAVIALDVVVGKDGSVESVRPLNGPPVLARSAQDALRWWKFEPYRSNGKPVVVETTVAVEFKP